MGPKITYKSDLILFYTTKSKTLVEKLKVRYLRCLPELWTLFVKILSCNSLSTPLYMSNKQTYTLYFILSWYRLNSNHLRTFPMQLSLPLSLFTNKRCLSNGRIILTTRIQFHHMKDDSHVVIFFFDEIVTRNIKKTPHSIVMSIVQVVKCPTF